MTRAFTYGSWDDPTPTDAFVGSPIALEETREYLLHLASPISPKQRQILVDQGARFVSSQVVSICFRNYVGKVEILGVPVEIESSKISVEEVASLLRQISELSSALIFSWKTPIQFEAGASLTALSPIPYHQFQFLRRSMLRAPIGSRLQDFVSSVERDPIRRFESDRPVLPVQRVRRIDSGSLRSIFTRMDRLAALPDSSPLTSNTLSNRLTFGNPAKAHFPAKIAASARTLSFDSPENRFVKHVLQEALSLTYRFSSHTSVHTSVRAEGAEMQAILESLMESPVISGSSNLTSFSGPTQALAKADGYRDVFSFWQNFSRHVSLPLDEVETERLLEGRDLAKLYEYWVFLRVLDSVVRAANCDKPNRILIRRSELGESLGNAIFVQVKDDLTVEFNPSYSRSTKQSYSTTLRPDVVVTAGTRRFAFDAKYKLERPDSAEQGDEEDLGVASYKQADLYKMHTYRDAIARLKTSVAVYPGHEFVFFDRSGTKATTAADVVEFDGIGAVPLRPQQVEAADNELDDFITHCINV